MIRNSSPKKALHSRKHHDLSSHDSTSQLGVCFAQNQNQLHYTIIAPPSSVAPFSVQKSQVDSRTGGVHHRILTRTWNTAAPSQHKQPCRRGSADTNDDFRTVKYQEYLDSWKTNQHPCELVLVVFPATQHDSAIQIDGAREGSRYPYRSCFTRIT